MEVRDKELELFKEKIYSLKCKLSGIEIQIQEQSVFGHIPLTFEH